MCQVTLTSIEGVSANNINVDSIVLRGTASSSCANVKLEITGCDFSSLIVIVPVTGGQWQHQVEGDCFCGRTVKVDAWCCDSTGKIIEGCGVNSFVQPIICTANCCLDVQLTPVIGDCNTNGERLVTFNGTVFISASQSSCLPYVLQLDFGDGTSSPAQLITSAGSHSFSVSHYYNAGLSYSASIAYVLPSGLSCPTSEIQIAIPPCTSDCCPQISDVKVEFGDCNETCERPTIITTSFVPPSGNCPPAFLEWKLVDKNGSLTTGTAFTTASLSPHVEQFWLDPTNSPYTATLAVAYPDRCAEFVRSITVPKCESDPHCPKITNLSYVVGGCKEEDGECCREVTINFDADVNVGCGNGPKPKIRVYFGDGQFQEIGFQTSGNYQVSFPHNYCKGGGDYEVTIETLFPNACLEETTTVSVPECRPEDCKQNGDPKFCWCCLLLMLVVLGYYSLWVIGLYQGDLSVLGYPLGSKLGVASALFQLLIFLIIMFCFRFVKSCKKCWHCRVFRCMFYALVLVITLIIIVVIAAYFTGNLAAFPGWFEALVSAFTYALVFYSLMQTTQCLTFYDTGKCK